MANAAHSTTLSKNSINQNQEIMRLFSLLTKEEKQAFLLNLKSSIQNQQIEVQ